MNIMPTFFGLRSWALDEIFEYLMMVKDCTHEHQLESSIKYHKCSTRIEHWNFVNPYKWKCMMATWRVCLFRYGIVQWQCASRAYRFLRLSNNALTALPPGIFDLLAKLEYVPLSQGMHMCWYCSICASDMFFCSGGFCKSANHPRPQQARAVETQDCKKCLDMNIESVPRRYFGLRKRENLGWNLYSFNGMHQHEYLITHIRSGQQV